MPSAAPPRLPPYVDQLPERTLWELAPAYHHRLLDHTLTWWDDEAQPHLLTGYALPLGRRTLLWTQASEDPLAPRLADLLPEPSSDLPATLAAFLRRSVAPYALEPLPRPCVGLGVHHWDLLREPGQTEPGRCVQPHLTVESRRCVHCGMIRRSYLREPMPDGSRGCIDEYLPPA
jgi:hypothetical protein